MKKKLKKKKIYFQNRNATELITSEKITGTH